MSEAAGSAARRELSLSTPVEQAPIRVMVVLNAGLLLEGMVVAIDQEDDLALVGSASGFAEAVELCERHRPDLAIVRTHARRWDAYALALALTGQHPAIAIVGIGDAAGEPVEHAAFDALVALDAGIDGLLATVRHVAARRRDDSPPLATIVLDVAERTSVTPRQQEVLERLASGMTAGDIAKRLGISANTVGSHKRRLFEALGVHNQAHAVALAARAGLLDPGVVTSA